MVLATDRYAAADGAALVEVDYEELPAIVDPKQLDGQGRGRHPRGHRRQDRGRPRPAHAPEPHLHLGGRRQGRGRRGLRRRRGDGARGDPQPARAPLPAGDLRLRGQLQQGHRLPDGVHDDAGAAPGAHRAGDAVGRGREQDPRRRRRHRRRLRQQGAGVPGLRRRHRRVASSPACRSSGSNRASTTSRTTGFARDYHGVGELAADANGVIKGLRFTALADHGAFNSHVSATKFPAGLFRICTGSYAIPNAYCRVDAVYTNKAPGGVAYRCSLRVTEAIYLIERMIDVLAQKLGIDKAEIRRRNFVKDEAVPLHHALRLDAGQRRLPHGARQGAEGGGLRRPAQASRPPSAPTRTARR